MASSSNREEDSDIRERFDSVCRELNMDEGTAEEAWRSYEKIKTNYSLEVCSTQYFVTDKHESLLLKLESNVSYLSYKQ
jgi:hypothetical protein